MSYPTNILQQVITYQESGLAYLQNLNCFISTANTKFENFQNLTANLGNTVSFDLPYRFTSSAGLVASFQGIAQRLQNLIVDQSANVSYSSTNQERLFTLDKEGFMERVGKGAIHELSAAIEKNVALNASSHVPVCNSAGTPTGALHTESGPVRFYGDGVTAINSYQQLEQAVTNFKDAGAPAQDFKFYLPNTIVPTIIGSGLAQFVPKRNEDTAQSWEIGEFGSPAVKYYRSNLLPIHTAGLIGNGSTDAIQTLTVVSTDDPTGANITTITCTCDGSLSGATGVILSGDLGQFVDGVSGKTNVRTMSFVGHHLTAQPAQVRASASANAASTTVVLTLAVPLCATTTATQNINTNIVAGMKIKLLPSHRCGLIVTGNALYIAMPRLPEEVPFPTAAQYDKDTGVSMRMYYGSLFGQNQRGMVHDAIWASTLVPEYSMRVCFPLTA